MGPANHGKVRAALRRIKAASAAGVDVACDVYPYAASSTRLSSRLPDWALDGGPDGRLRDPGLRGAIRAELGERIGRTVLPAGTIVADLPAGPFSDRSGSSVAEIAAATAREPVDVILDLLRDHQGDVWIVNHAMAESDVEFVLADELSSVVSDGWLLDLAGAGHPHPRHFGAFARAIAEYLRDRGVLELAEVVRKLSAAPAGRIGLCDRGFLAKGKIADVVVFDPERYADTATYRPRSRMRWGPCTCSSRAGSPPGGSPQSRSPRAGAAAVARESHSYRRNAHHTSLISCADRRDSPDSCFTWLIR
ncbi:N-acyl-D-amino-acid deacylase [Amycolatopsis pretoriensis]|uniref:N-acyl-D-amino-acid deacylase n=1 Tax=Amycolatopsis pretoriensis TaxID=218821 RepID=A0A1H5RIB3_9PSEU|nr:N-acyl-D-amino-acid deacylase [Amycolatopsis pretoriensis]